MSKELEALNYLVNLAVVGNKENNREKVFTSEEIILQALKRNEPMKATHSAHSIYDDEYCPKCGNALNTKIGFHACYCPHCGQRLDWSDEK